MLEKTTEKLNKVFTGFLKQIRLNEKNIKDGIREIKLLLLEADVNYKVVKDFIHSVELEAFGNKVLKSVTPTQQFIKIVHDKLVDIMGGEKKTIQLKKNGLSSIMLLGLQGTGKTTTCIKIAKYLKQGKKVCVVSADVHRPSAREQLRLLSQKGNIDFLDIEKRNAVNICKKAIQEARRKEYNILIVDTAGRLQIDTLLMNELKEMKEILNPDETLFVCDAMTGQNIVEVLLAFNKALKIDGVILSKFDSDTRGGVALSITKATGKNIKFIGTGERIEDLEVFHPERIANCILGKGDIVGFVEKIESAFDLKQSMKSQKNSLKGQFTLNSFLDQIKQIKKIGSLESLIKHLPFQERVQQKHLDRKEILHTEAIILSMTKKERDNYKILNGSRRKRIASGSGTSVQQINRLIKKFEEMQKIIKKMKKNPNSLKGLLGKI